MSMRWPGEAGIAGGSLAGHHNLKVEANQQKGDPSPNTDHLGIQVQFDRDHLLSPGLK